MQWLNRYLPLREIYGLRNIWPELSKLFNHFDITVSIKFRALSSLSTLINVIEKHPESLALPEEGHYCIIILGWSYIIHPGDLRLLLISIFNLMSISSVPATNFLGVFKVPVLKILLLNCHPIRTKSGSKVFVTHPCYHQAWPHPNTVRLSITSWSYRQCDRAKVS